MDYAMKKSPPLLAAGLFAYALMHQTLFCAASTRLALKRARTAESARQKYTDTTDPESYPTATPLELTVPALPPPPPAAIAKRAPTIQETLSEVVTCAICMEDKEMRLMSKLPCNHLFDRECITEWLQMGRTCPFCKTDPEILKEKNDDLFAFSTAGQTKKVSAVVAAGGIVNATQYAGRTPLMEAAFHGREAVVRTLLAAGAKVHARDWQNHTALLFAVKGEHPRVVQAIIDATPEDERAMLVNVEINNGATPLHFAVCKGNLAIVKKLVAAGADMTATNASGYTPLRVAQLKLKYHDTQSIVDYLEPLTPTA
jgi:hypothetical protein